MISEVKSLLRQKVQSGEIEIEYMEYIFSTLNSLNSTDLYNLRQSLLDIPEEWQNELVSVEFFNN